MTEPPAGFTPAKRKPMKRLNEMNGDYLSYLMTPLKSEMNRGVHGLNWTENAKLRKQLQVWHKERNINLDKLKRSQEAAYCSLLRVHKDKMIVQRDSWKKQQIQSREAFEKAMSEKEGTTETRDLLKPVYSKSSPNVLEFSSAEGTATHSSKSTGSVINGNRGKVINGKIREDGQADASTAEHNQIYSGNNQGSATLKTVERGDFHSIGETSPKQVDSEVKISSRKVKMKSKVLEVRRKDPLHPITKELTELTKEPDKDLFVNTQTTYNNHMFAERYESEPLPNKPYFQANIDTLLESATSGENHGVNESGIVPNVRELDRVNTERRVSRLPKRTGVKHTNYLPADMPPIFERSEHNLILSKGNVFQPVDSGVHAVTSHQGKQNLIRQPADVKRTVPLSPDIAMTSHTRLISLVAANKRRAKDKELKRRKVLENESFQVYLKNDEGDIVPSGLPFKREEFLVTTQNEKRIRQKLIESQQNALEENKRKVESFFEKVALEDDRRAKLIERKIEKLTETKKAPSPVNVGMTLTHMMQAFASNTLPTNSNPNSAEALATCKYIRVYTALTPREKIEAQRNKRSSWEGSRYSA